jgi:hypothetical protein
VVKTVGSGVGRDVGIMQFNGETDSGSMIGTVEIDGSCLDLQEIGSVLVELVMRIVEVKDAVAVDLGRVALHQTLSVERALSLC